MFGPGPTLISLSAQGPQIVTVEGESESSPLVPASSVRDKFAVSTAVLAIVLVLVAFCSFLAVQHGTDVIVGGFDDAAKGNGTCVPAWRLPSNVKPKAYRLSFFPLLREPFTFSGRIEIDVDILEPTHCIFLHAHYLDIPAKSVRLTGITASKFAFRLHPDFELVSLEFKTPLEPGPATLHLDFTGKLRCDELGFFLTSYLESPTDPTSVRHYIAATMFEGTYARWAFPCFDEPALKAVFTIDVLVEGKCDLAVLSNMPEDGPRKVEHVPGHKGPVCRVQFQPSPIMSSYLVCVVAGPLEMIAAKAKLVQLPPGELAINATTSYPERTIPVSVWARRGYQEQGWKALDVAIHVLPYFEQLFGVAFPLPKLDLVGLPDFMCDGMENWGLITFGEPYVLANADTPVSDLQQTIATVAHELSHMWFGDLVTMDWWDGLWLNEGFATIWEFIGTNYTHPELQYLDLFILEEQQMAFGRDGLPSTHPVLSKALTPADIETMFDDVTYAKGASLLRMLRFVIDQADPYSPEGLPLLVSSSPFMTGIRNYLLTHAYKNTQTTDLWQALSESSGLDITTLMDSWTQIRGFPIVTVDVANVAPPSAGNQVQVKLDVSQRSVLASAYGKQISALWNIPITFFPFVAGSKGAGRDILPTNNVVMLTGQSTSAVLELPTATLDPATVGVKLNTQQSG